MIRKLTIALVVMSAVAISAGAALATTTFDASAAPNGTHVQSGTPGCVADGLTVTCASYELAGVGNTNAQATLVGTYSAIVDCTNKGGKLVPVKSTLQSAPATTGQLEPKNGRLTVPVLTLPTSSSPSDADFLNAATCPNGNWTKSLASGDPTLDSWVYTLTFAGFNTPYITITP